MSGRVYYPVPGPGSGNGVFLPADPIAWSGELSRRGPTLDERCSAGCPKPAAAGCAGRCIDCWAEEVAAAARAEGGRPE